MAEEPRTGVAGLGQAFAEFALLPDLLQASASGAAADGDWTPVLEAHGFNDGHVHPGDLEGVQRGGLATFMARDAKRMCERLRLLDSEGLTEAGRRVAEAAAVPILERPSAAERAAAAVVGDQIRRHYVGADGLELVPLVQQSSARLAAEQQPAWAVLPGLLLAEFDTVLYRGLTDAARARDLAGELPRVRAEVVERLERGDLQPGDYGPGHVRRRAGVLALRAGCAGGAVHVVADRAPGDGHGDDLVRTAQGGIRRLRGVRPGAGSRGGVDVACDRRAVALRDGLSWRFRGQCRTAQKMLGLMVTHDFRAVDRRVLSSLGLDPKTRRRQGNEIRPGTGKHKVTIHDTRIINRGLAMELLVSTLLTCLDQPAEVKSWCTVSAKGYPNNCAPGPHPDIVATYADFRIVAEVSCQRDVTKTSFFEEQLCGAIKHALAEAMLPGPGRVYALVIAGYSIETNLEMRGKYADAQGQLKKELTVMAERCRQAGRPVPDVRLLSVKSKVFDSVCEEIFGAPGQSCEGLAISSATLARALDEARAGLEDKRDIGKKGWLRRVLVKELQSPAEERLPIEV